MYFIIFFYVKEIHLHFIPATFNSLTSLRSRGLRGLNTPSPSTLRDVF